MCTSLSNLLAEVVSFHIDYKRGPGPLSLVGRAPAYKRKGTGSSPVVVLDVAEVNMVLFILEDISRV